MADSQSMPPAQPRLAALARLPFVLAAEASWPALAGRRLRDSRGQAPKEGLAQIQRREKCER